MLRQKTVFKTILINVVICLSAFFYFGNQVPLELLFFLNGVKFLEHAFIFSEGVAVNIIVCLARLWVDSPAYP